MYTMDILLIEDDVIEVMKFKRVLSLIDDGNTYKFEMAENGEDALKILEINAMELESMINYGLGKKSLAIDGLLLAYEKECEIGYWEPPHYTKPVLETLGSIYTLEGDMDNAIKSFNKVLKSRPENGHTQYALANSMRNLGAEKEIVNIQYKKFLSYWKDADSLLFSIKKSRNYLLNSKFKL